MSSLEFDRRYRLLKVVAAADGIRTHNAQDLTTGRVVMVHVLDDAGPEAVDTMRRRIARLPTADKSRVLETATLSAGFAVVTEFLPAFHSFAAWVAERLGEPTSPAPATAPLAPPASAAPWPDASSITEARGAESPAVTTPIGEAVSSDDASPDPLADEVGAAPPQSIGFTVGVPVGGGNGGTPGEFTRLFVAGGRVNIESSASPPSPPVAPHVPPFGVPSPNGATAKAPSPAAPPGSFTQMFGAPSAPSAATPPASAPAPPSVQPPAPPPDAVRPPAAPPAPPAEAAAPALVPGEFTRMFHAPTPAPLAGASSSPLVGAGGPPSPPAFAAPLAPPSSPAAATPSASGPAFGPAPANLPQFGPPSALGGSATSALAAQSLPSSPGGPAPGAFGPPSPLAAFGSSVSASAANPAAGAPAVPSGVTGGRPATPAPFGDAPPPARLVTPPFGMPAGGNAAGLGGSPFGAAPASGGGSEYTRMVRQASPPPPPVAPAAPAAPARPAAPPRAPVPMPLVVAINAVVLLAIALVLYFVFRPKSPVGVPTVPPLTAPAVQAPTTQTPAPAAPAAAPAPPAGATTR